MFTACSLTDLFLQSLKSQEQKTFKARLPVVLIVQKLFPNDLDILEGKRKSDLIKLWKLIKTMSKENRQTCKQALHM